MFEERLLEPEYDGVQAHQVGGQVHKVRVVLVDQLYHAGAEHLQVQAQIIPEM